MMTKQGSSDVGSAEEEVDSWNVYYEPAPQFRNVHADGMVVAPSDEDLVSITFYSERIAIPKQVKMELDPKSQKLSETYVHGKRGTIRYLEDTVFLNKKTAKDLIKWLEKVTEFLERDDSEGEGDG